MLQRLPKDEYSALCKSILQRDGYKCRSCGMRSNIHVHHIVFRSQQGPDAAWNLITLCSSCHDGVHKDVKDGEYGLTVALAGNPLRYVFIRRTGWRPQ